MEYSLLVPAFIAGLLTFLAPCTLPLVPGYLGFISGVSLGDLGEPAISQRFRRRIFFNGLFFILGFAAVFIIFGALAGFIGSALVPWRLWLGRIGGAVVILFGLAMLGLFRIPLLSRGFGLKMPAVFSPGHPVNSLLFGSAFAFGWTPCVGPILGTVLLLASTSATALKGAILLAAFSAGLAVPFLAIALGIGSAAVFIGRFSRFLPAISAIGGLFLIFFGVLLLTDNFTLLISYGYKWFRFLEYERLLDYL